MEKPFLTRISCIIALSTAMVLTNCATGPRKKPSEPAPIAAREALNKLEIQRAAGSGKKLIRNLDDFAKKYPGTDLAHDARIMLAEIHRQNKNYDEAYAAYISVVNSETFSPREADAILGATFCLIQLGRYDEALSLSQKGLQLKDLSTATRVELSRYRMTLLDRVGDRVDALKTAIFLAMNDTGPAAREQFRIRAIDIVETKLTENELKSVSDESGLELVRGPLQYRLGLTYYEQKDLSRARGAFERVVEAVPDTEMATEAATYLAQIESRRKVEPKTIGTVLPLSGRHAFIGQKTLQGLQLGLGIFGRDRSEFRLAVMDSEGQPDLARRGVERLVTEDHVIAVVGSLLSRTASTVAAKSHELGVPSIGLSQKSGLTQAGDYVFRNALTSEMLVRHLVQVAMDVRGLKRFAILYPNDAYGVEYANLFWDEVLARGGEIRGAQAYKPDETDFGGAIRRLVGTYYFEDRQNEYKHAVGEWYKKRKQVSQRVQPPEDLLPPVVDFEAIFIPDGVKALGQIGPMLAFNNVKDMKLLGTNLWNSSSLVSRAQKFAEGALFGDSDLSNEEAFKKSEFFREFKNTYGEEPNVFAAHGYEAGLLLRQLIASGNRTRPALRDALQSVRDFRGTLGNMSMSPDRELTRSVVMLSVEEGKIIPIRDVDSKVR